MKFVCYREFDDPAEPIHPGIALKGKVLPLARLIAVAEAITPRNLDVPIDIFELIAALPRYAEAVKDLSRESRLIDKLWPEVGVVVAAPIPRPNRIFCIGRNYAEHAKETGSEVNEEPIVFLKASSTVIGMGQPIVYPEWAEQVDYEGELAVVIGMPGKDIPEKDAMKHVVGYTLFNDVTERLLQNRDIAKSLPWFRSKSIDTFGPLGPVIVTADEIRDPHKLTIRTEVNGVVKQEAPLSDMVYRVPRLISYLSKYFALEAGDVIATGTPSGIGPLHPGDTVSVSIPEIGTLTNPVVAAAEL
jgi:2-keto-4-pentenoate hydratase/2-oxohepta-3-ene-1,7-dioic acid hydratase in catechol pathway